MKESLDLQNPLLFKITAQPVPQVLSRKPSYILANELIDAGYDAVSSWNDSWENANLENSDLILDPSLKMPGFDLRRDIWTKLNRIRTGHGRCNSTLHQWGLLDDPSCDCGFTIQDVDSTLMDLHSGGVLAIEWLNSLDIKL